MALVTQTVVGNREKKMLCYTVAIDNFPHSHPNFSDPTSRPLEDFGSATILSNSLILSLLLVAVLLRRRLVNMLKTASDRRLTSLLNNPVMGEKLNRLQENGGNCITRVLDQLWDLRCSKRGNERLNLLSPSTFLLFAPK
jgi:hypothetical protein